jgi:hypothetical protein
MFQFPRFPSTALWIQTVMPQHYLRQVALLGYLRISACLQLPEAYRSLPRPSSAPGAKASAVCSCSLDLMRCYLAIAVHFSRYKNPSP